MQAAKHFTGKILTSGIVTPLPISHTAQYRTIAPKIVESRDAVAVSFIQQAPVTVQQAQVTIQQAPVTVQQAPVTVHQTPVTVQQTPVTVQQAPVTVQPEQVAGISYPETAVGQYLMML